MIGEELTEKIAKKFPDLYIAPRMLNVNPKANKPFKFHIISEKYVNYPTAYSQMETKAKMKFVISTPLYQYAGQFESRTVCSNEDKPDPEIGYKIVGKKNMHKLLNLYKRIKITENYELQSFINDNYAIHG